jgi:secreted trypsin-like serine protease
VHYEINISHCFCFYFIEFSYGKIQGRVRSGYPIDIEQAPYIAFVEYKTATPKIYVMCGGSILNQRYVMTAGHC